MSLRVDIVRVLTEVGGMRSYDIRYEVPRRWWGLRPSIAAVLFTLNRMEQDKIVEAIWRSDARVMQAKFYRLTAFARPVAEDFASRPAVSSRDRQKGSRGG